MDDYGTLTNDNNWFYNSGNVSVASAATFGIKGWNSDGIASLVSDTNVDFAAGSFFAIDTSLYSTSLLLSRSGLGFELLKLGSDTLTVSGSYTYSGGTDVAGGTLAVYRDRTSVPEV